MFNNRSVGKMWGLVLGILLVSLATNLSVQAGELTEWQKKVVAHFNECKETHELSLQDMEDLKNNKMPDTEEAKCYFACVFKKSEMMNEKGEFWAEGIKKSSMERYGNDEARQKKTDNFINVCKKVNDVPVTDGERGCDRAALMYKCTMEQAHELGVI